jgi:predicted enzyme related to lactoylglutathione lyase
VGETSRSDKTRVRFECIDPILRVESMQTSLRFYVELLGFENAGWGNNDFTHISRDGCGIYLSRGDQGQGRAWIWVGVEDVGKLNQEYTARGITIRLPPTNYPWALEMQIEDPDGNVLRLGSDPIET